MKYRPTILVIASDERASRAAEASLPAGYYRTFRALPAGEAPDLVVRQWNDPQPRPELHVPVIDLDLHRCRGASLRRVVGRVLGAPPLLL